MTRAGGVTIAERRRKYRQPTPEDQQPKVALPPVPAAAIPNLTLEPAGDESEEENEEEGGEGVSGGSSPLLHQD